MRIVTIVFCALLVNAFAFAQEVTVVNADTGEPLSHASVTTQGKDRYEISDANGRVDLSGFSENDLLFFNHVAFETYRARKGVIVGRGVSVGMMPLSEQLDEVVLSASKWKERRDDVDQRVVLINKEEVLFSNAQTSADLLQSSGKVFMQKSQLGGGSPMIRGFATNRLLLVVDGVRMNNAIFRGGNIQNIISIDPLTVERTEVVFGPGSVIYGSDAVGGVMNFFTETPELRFEGAGINGRALARYASANNERTVHSLLNYGGRHWAGVSAVTYSDFNDLIMGNHGPDEFLRPEYVSRIDGIDVVVPNDNPRKQTPTAYEQVNFLQKFRFVPSSAWELKANLIYSTTSDYARYDRLTRYRNGVPRAAEWYYGPQQWFLGSLSAEIHARNKWFDELRVTNAYQQFGESRNDRDFSDDQRFVTSEKVHAFSSNADLKKELGTKSTLYYGLEYLYNKVRSDGKVVTLPALSEASIASRYPDGSVWESFAAYTNLNYRPGRRLTFRAGLRYTLIDIDADFRDNNVFYNLPFDTASIHTDALTGSLGVHWRPGRMLQFRLQGATAFRAPNIDDIGKIFDSEPGSVVVPNPGLNPEYAYNIDLGAQLNMLERLKVDLTYFHSWLKDAMVRRDFSYNGLTQIEYNGELSNIQAIQNASKARVYGFEGAVDWRLSDVLNVKGAMTWVKGEEVLEDGSESPLRHAAPLFGHTALTYKKERLRLEFWAQFNGEISYDNLAISERGKPYLYAIDGNGDPYAASWYTLNLRGAYDVLEQTRLQLALENITDQRYRTYSSGIAAAGINLVVTLRQTF